AGKRGAKRVFRLARLFDPKPGGAEQLGHLVVAWIRNVGADITAAEKVALVGLLRAPASVVHHDAHRVDAMRYRGADLAHRHAESAVAHQAQYRPVRTRELRAEPA